MPSYTPLSITCSESTILSQILLSQISSKKHSSIEKTLTDLLSYLISSAIEASYISSPISIALLEKLNRKPAQMQAHSSLLALKLTHVAPDLKLTHTALFEKDEARPSQTSLQ